MEERNPLRVYFLLDRSASMESLWTEALGSINGYVDRLIYDTPVVLATFDDQSYDILRNTTAREWRRLSNEDAQPRGMTPLYDAGVRMMQRILEDNPERAYFITMTDGQENASKKYNQQNVLDYVAKLERKKYEVVFLGANFTKVHDTGALYGASFLKTLNIKPERLHDTMNFMASATRAYGLAGTATAFDAQARMMSGEIGGDVDPLGPVTGDAWGSPDPTPDKKGTRAKK
jgi:hypothetical protein